MKNIDLRQLGHCFEGLVPATIATVSADGVPNISFVSHVYMVDSRHVATSYQFFSKTRANILHNQKAVIEVLDPDTLQPYKLRVRYLRSELEGGLYDAMSMRLQVIASHEGMSEIFSLKAADVYEVLDVEAVEGYSRLSAQCIPAEPVESPKIELLQVITERIVRAQCLEHLLEKTLDLLAKFFGLTHMKILLVGENPRTLVTHMSYGYEQNGAGSEVSFGDGVIGLAAENKKALKISGVDLGIRYARATRKSVENSKLATKLSNPIPLPGLAPPASQLAIPIIACDEVLGVFVVESPTKKHWTIAEKSILTVVVNQLGTAIRALSHAEEKSELEEYMPAVNTKAAKEELEVKFLKNEESIFLNNSYLIKNLPAKILWHLLTVYQETGRQDFSNIELRSQSQLNLSEVKDNLEARLVLLKKRLQQQSDRIRIVNTARGRFRLEVDGRLKLLNQD